MAEKTWFADLNTGSDLSDLYWRYNGSAWFERMALMEMIRLSSIPRSRRGQGESLTPFRVVNRVINVRVPSFDMVQQKLAVDVIFDIEGVGEWAHTLSIFISTPEQLVESRARALEFSNAIKEIENQHRKL